MKKENVKLALLMNKLVHNECKDVPHDIGARLMELIEEYQSKQLNLLEVISWVAVAERLPEIPSENYLVVKNGIVGISLFRGDWNKFQCDLHDIQEVTHWAECPKPPCL